MRREFLKGYIMAMLASGDLKGTPAQMAKKALSIFSSDLPEVVSEIMDTVAGNMQDKIMSVVVSKAADIVKDIGARGPKQVAKDLKKFWDASQAQYWRGAAALRDRK